MKHGTCTFEQFVIYGLAAALALAVAFTPGAARSGAYSTDRVEGFGPCWSNDHHHEHGLIFDRDYVPLPPGVSAEYVPGRDAWGCPINPAEPPKSFNESFPVKVDVAVNLDTKTIAGQEIELHAGRFAFDPVTNELSLNGRT